MADTPAGITTDHHQPADTSTSLRVLVVDDHALVRSGVRSELTARAPNLDIIAKADDIGGTVTVAHTLQPDVVLFDVHLPDGSGGGRAEVVASCHGVPGARLLTLSVSDTNGDVVGVIRTNARDYVTKAIPTEDLAQAVRHVATGDAAFSPHLAGLILDAFGAGAGEVAVTDIELDRLSACEREAMRLIARGCTYEGYVSELFISVKTVETHASAVLRKLQLSNHSKLTRWTVARRTV